ncbi:outer dense fiber protein 3 [Trichonephila inaurata madagascariensis]|uniref:Outer dense fiber protein 3 n=1 Tax=Trichonephila inaurata madagascariensis TaxID=2747483 RepID=A0A8X6YQN3_9ARAC|nr:outer dense fiber protein 3 [Trichonephila inaurata madagascariensis]
MSSTRTFLDYFNFCHHQPGNRDYLSYYKYQGEPSRTSKPAGIIDAVNTGPGPAVVNLPTTIGEQDHDPRRLKAPAYKIGERDLRQYHPCGPGAATYDTRKLTNKGIDECHAPKIGEKFKKLTTFMPPGPTTYNRGDSDKFAYPKSPAYSMGVLHEGLQAFQGPAPDRYTLPPSLGTVHKYRKTPYAGGPAFTIGDRLKGAMLGTNPGPAAYKLPSTNTNKQKPPAYTIGIKPKQIVPFISPGPGSNEIHLVKLHKPAPPRFTFGIRHSPFEVFPAFAASD